MVKRWENVAYKHTRMKYTQIIHLRERKKTVKNNINLSFVMGWNNKTRGLQKIIDWKNVHLLWEKKEREIERERREGIFRPSLLGPWQKLGREKTVPESLEWTIHCLSFQTATPVETEERKSLIWCKAENELLLNPQTSTVAKLYILPCTVEPLNKEILGTLPLFRGVPHSEVVY